MKSIERSFDLLYAIHKGTVKEFEKENQALIAEYCAIDRYRIEKRERPVCYEAGKEPVYVHDTDTTSGLEETRPGEEWETV